jgi:hypothetical protein
LYCQFKTTYMKKEQFLKEIKGTQFEADFGNELNVNGAPTSKAYWNLILSIRDCKLYSKGIKPHRNWKITDVKWYFGVKGGAQVIAEKLEQYRGVLVAE